MSVQVTADAGAICSMTAANASGGTKILGFNWCESERQDCIFSS